MNTPQRPQVTGWWHAGPSEWHRYYGRFNLAAKRIGQAYYLVTITTDDGGKVHEIPASSMRAAKAAAEAWVSNR